MILYTDSVPLTPRQRELVRIQSPDFPYSAMEGELTRYPNRGALWHWHDYFEFVVIHRGLVELDLERESVLLRAGDGYFVNANVLHQVIAAPGSDCGCTRTQLFDGALLSGAGLIGRRYIGPIESCASLNARILRADDPDDQPVLAAFNAAFAAAEGDAEGYELEVCAHHKMGWCKNRRRLMRRATSWRSAPICAGPGRCSTAWPRPGCTPAARPGRAACA